jgi:hypothetical protein
MIVKGDCTYIYQAALKGQWNRIRRATNYTYTNPST